MIMKNIKISKKKKLLIWLVSKSHFYEKFKKYNKLLLHLRTFKTPIL